MSADNWAICPKCEKLEEEKVETLKSDVKSKYGKVSEKKYLDLIMRVERTVELEDTLREDYAIGLVEGKLKIQYYGSCERCGFKKEFKTSEALDF